MIQQVIEEGPSSVGKISPLGGDAGVAEQGIPVQDEQQGGQGAALTDATELGVTEGGPPSDEGCVAWMLSRAEASPLQNALVCFNVHVRCDSINQEAKSWLPRTTQPKVKAIGELDDVPYSISTSMDTTPVQKTSPLRTRKITTNDAAVKKAPSITLCVPLLRKTSTTPWHPMRFSYVVMSRSCHGPS